MRLTLERSSAASMTASASGPVLVEMITPRTNAATLSAAEHLYAALVGARGLALELAGDAAGRRLYARAADTSIRARLTAQLGAAYPQAHARPASSADDPACRQPGEQLAVCTLGLAAPEYLPLRVPRDAELAADRAPQADPLLGVLAALGDLPPAASCPCPGPSPTAPASASPRTASAARRVAAGRASRSRSTAPRRPPDARASFVAGAVPPARTAA